MTRRHALALCSAIVAAVLVLVLLDERDPAPADLGARVAPERVGEIGTTADLTELSAEETARVLPVIEEEDEEEEDDDWTDALPAHLRPDAGFVQFTVLTGRIVIVEPDGTETRDARGRLTIAINPRPGTFGRARGQNTRVVDVADGRFEAAADRGPRETIGLGAGGGIVVGEPSDLSVRVTPLEFEGGPAIVIADPTAESDPAQFDVGEEDIVLRLRRIPEFTLHVVDAATGAALEDVRLLSMASSYKVSDGHPADQSVGKEYTAARSPLRFRPRSQRGGTRCFVTSPGYAWAFARIDVMNGGERTVELEPGGDLEVTIDGQLGGPHRLRIYRDGDQPFVDLPAKSNGVRRFDALPLGDYLVRIERGKQPTADGVRYTANAAVLRGRTQELTFDVEPAPIERTGRIGGTLFAPPEWTIEELGVRLRRLESRSGASIGPVGHMPREPKPVEGAADRYTFFLGLHSVGRYQVTIPAVGIVETFELTSADRMDLELTALPPVELSVQVENAQDGTPLDVGSVRWRGVEEVEGKRLGGGSEYESNGHGRFELRVPAREIEITAATDDHAAGSVRVVPVPDSIVRLRLEPAYGRTLRLVANGATVPWPPGTLEVSAVGHTGRMEKGVHRDQGRWIKVTKPGLYRIELPEIDRFQIPDSVEVEFSAGPAEDVEIPILQVVR